MKKVNLPCILVFAMTGYLIDLPLFAHLHGHYVLTKHYCELALVVVVAVFCVFFFFFGLVYLSRKRNRQITRSPGKHHTRTENSRQADNALLAKPSEFNRHPFCSLGLFRQARLNFILALLILSESLLSK